MSRPISYRSARKNPSSRDSPWPLSASHPSGVCRQTAASFSTPLASQRSCQLPPAVGPASPRPTRSRPDARTCSCARTPPPSESSHHLTTSQRSGRPRPRRRRQGRRLGQRQCGLNGFGRAHCHDVVPNSTARVSGDSPARAAAWSSPPPARSGRCDAPARGELPPPCAGSNTAALLRAGHDPARTAHRLTATADLAPSDRRRYAEARAASPYRLRPAAARSNIAMQRRDRSAGGSGSAGSTTGASRRRWEPVLPSGPGRAATRRTRHSRPAAAGPHRPCVSP